MSDLDVKLKINDAIYNKLLSINKVISVTLVGSFVNSDDLSGISDIDTIVICKNLNEEVFKECIVNIKSISLSDCGLYDYSLQINTTFGPLKFDSPRTAIIHLMIYDIDLHRKHVLASPFTCFDWERSKNFKGYSLKSIFPVGTLQIRDFLEVRRSLNNYLEDIKKNIISYREYNFSNQNVVEIKKEKKLDIRHQGEFAFHIIKNLVTNYLKLIWQKNVQFKNEVISREIKRLIPDSGDMITKAFNEISLIKQSRKHHFPNNIISIVEKFLKEFQKSISEEWSSSKKIIFIRHFETTLNDGTFLGQGRDPSINQIDVNIESYQPVSKVYTSPLKRCVESAQIIYQNNNINFDDRLLEFNYGDAEGLSYKSLIENYPEINDSWQYGNDPKFPNGENTSDVFIRLKSFLNSLSNIFLKDNNNSVSIVTHNGIIRCLLGDAYRLGLSDWYKLKIPHGVELEFLYREGRFYPNISRKLISKIFENIGHN